MKKSEVNPEISKVQKPKCIHNEIRNKNIEGFEVLVCVNCTKVVKPEDIAYEIDSENKKVSRNIVLQIPLPDDIRLCSKRSLDDGNMSFQWSVDVTPDMILHVGGINFVPVANVNIGDRIKVYRNNNAKK